MDGEAVATFLGLAFTFAVIVIIVAVLIKAKSAEASKKRMEQYKQRTATQQRPQQATVNYGQQSSQSAAKMRQIAQAFGLSIDGDEDEQAKKHAKHVEDSHAHEHLGEEEHYEEIVGSLGEVSDEGCADLSGVRFIANDLAYEIHSEQEIDYDRLAQAMVLGEIVNNPRFKAPHTRRK